MQQHWRMPDTFVILFFVALLASALSWWVPAGQFSTETVVRETPSGVQEREVLVADSYQAVPRDGGFKWFAEGGEIGLANIPFEGMVSGSKWGAAIGVMAFILLVGGSFGIIVKTTSIERGILALIHRTQRYDQLFLILLFLVFSLGGAVFGMGEEAIAFCLVLLPVMSKLGYDKVTVVLVTYVATQIGFAASWMNPFSVAIAQGIAEVPLLSGAGFRMMVWLLLTTVGVVYTLRYAKRTRQPQSQRAAASDPKIANEDSANQDTANQDTVNEGTANEKYAQSSTQPFTHLDTAILSVFTLGMVWVVWGVVARGYYIPELASQFFAIGIIIGLLAVFGQRFRANDMSEAFVKGAQDLLPAALIVGFAKGIILILGGGEPDTPSTLNTLLYYAGSSLSGMSEHVAAVSMLLFQGGFNFFMTSGSGQAALTMPIMAPLSDLAGVSRQTAILAFQLGDGLTNIVVPTSAALIGCLGAVKLDWATWLKTIWRFQVFLAGCCIIIMLVAVITGYK
ncbi:hypothetical protein CWE08_10475 [Aliidiomarina iranensis]|uniref:Basic amino acid antiporter YfcC n=1 Tax=Aliidiomarina iranensis TaxID=1434071 RepID=A0A432VRN5_9GAMM|nr:putative basic amino acid antiporter YfcC [Aliidiomarina iranensis]RUO18976.1 hypothetical protein CWE08_10475 [Aliidiomarina iranensis]